MPLVKLPKFDSLSEEMRYYTDRLEELHRLTYSLTLLHEEIKEGKADLTDVESTITNLLYREE